MLRKSNRAKLILCLSLLWIFGYAGYLASLDQSDLPPLQDGDLVFQTTWVPGSIAIGFASKSLYIHTGIVKHTSNGIVVVHAAQTVMETPLAEWIGYGVFSRFAVYRHMELTPKQAQTMLKAAEKYYGKAYDHYFSFNNDSIYCSELEYLAFKDAGMEIGQVQKIGSLSVNNGFVRRLIKERWQSYPACMGKGYDFDACYKVIMDGELVTPATIASDKHMKMIFSNYPW